jgi:putative ATPase
VLQLQPLTDADIAVLLDRAVIDERGLASGYTVTDDARSHLVALASGDARRALTALEAAADSVGAAGSPAADSSGDTATGPIVDPRALPVMDLQAVERAINRAAVRCDRAGDQHYDVTRRVH